MNPDLCTSSEDAARSQALIPMEILKTLVRHAQHTFPRECAGLVVYDRQGAWQVFQEPKGQSSVGFSLSASTVLRAHQTGVPRVMYHSHPNGVPYPSHRDRAMMVIDGEPAWPKVIHVIIALNQVGLVDMRAYLWNPGADDYDSVSLEYGRVATDT